MKCRINFYHQSIQREPTAHGSRSGASRVLPWPSAAGSASSSRATVAAWITNHPAACWKSDAAQDQQPRSGVDRVPAHRVAVDQIRKVLIEDLVDAVALVAQYEAREWSSSINETIVVRMKTSRHAHACATSHHRYSRRVCCGRSGASQSSSSSAAHTRGSASVSVKKTACSPPSAALFAYGFAVTMASPSVMIENVWFWLAGAAACRPRRGCRAQTSRRRQRTRSSRQTTPRAARSRAAANRGAAARAAARRATRMHGGRRRTAGRAAPAACRTRCRTPPAAAGRRVGAPAAGGAPRWRQCAQRRRRRRRRPSRARLGGAVHREEDVRGGEQIVHAAMKAHSLCGVTTASATSSDSAVDGAAVEATSIFRWNATIIITSMRKSRSDHLPKRRAPAGILAAVRRCRRAARTSTPAS